MTIRHLIRMRSHAAHPSLPAYSYEKRLFYTLIMPL